MPGGQPLTLSGSVRIPALEIKDTIEGERLLGWEMLDIDRFELGAGKLHLSRLNFVRAFGRIIVLKDLSTNLSGLLIEAAASSKPETEFSVDTPSDKFDFVVAGIRVENGSMEFSDLSLPLPFASYITRLNGTISTIATDSTEPAGVKLEGRVNDYGLARIDGTINVLDPVQHTGITLEFRNLLMPELSPYTIQFAGRKIDEGKLDLKLHYAIDGGQLQGENNIVISDLLLGDTVDHPDAASLPLGLAVALLKDANGIIDIELPVTGDLNDPEFKIGGIVFKAITGLISKVVTAPFRLLGKLIGVDSEDFGEFQFLAGRSDLTPPEMEKITQLEQVLGQRPQLRVEISGVMDPAIDTAALKSARLHAVVLERIGKEKTVGIDETTMLDVEIRSLLESLFIERYPDIPLDTLKAEHLASPSDGPEGKPELDNLAYSAGLRDRLLAAEPISEQDLADLAQARAEAIRTAFLASKQIDQSRISIVESRQAKSEDGQWVGLELAVTSE